MMINNRGGLGWQGQNPKFPEFCLQKPVFGLKSRLFWRKVTLGVLNVRGGRGEGGMSGLPLVLSTNLGFLLLHYFSNIWLSQIEFCPFNFVILSYSLTSDLDI